MILWSQSLERSKPTGVRCCKKCCVLCLCNFPLYQVECAISGSAVTVVSHSFLLCTMTPQDLIDILHLPFELFNETLCQSSTTFSPTNKGCLQVICSFLVICCWTLARLLSQVTVSFHSIHCTVWPVTQMAKFSFRHWQGVPCDHNKNFAEVPGSCANGYTGPWPLVTRCGHSCPHKIQLIWLKNLIPCFSHGFFTFIGSYMYITLETWSANILELENSKILLVWPLVLNFRHQTPVTHDNCDILPILGTWPSHTLSLIIVVPHVLHPLQ